MRNKEMAITYRLLITYKSGQMIEMCGDKATIREAYDDAVSAVEAGDITPHSAMISVEGYCDSSDRGVHLMSFCVEGILAISVFKQG